jgi:hypothetical protein
MLGTVHGVTAIINPDISTSGFNLGFNIGSLYLGVRVSMECDPGDITPWIAECTSAS